LGASFPSSLDCLSPIFKRGCRSGNRRRRSKSTR
jgi:hypothetical protein